jgi:hypothetical protein
MMAPIVAMIGRGMVEEIKFVYDYNLAGWVEDSVLK